MRKTCFCCGKEVKFLDSDLQNGKICDDCFEKAVKEDGTLTRFNIDKYSGEEICAIINQDKEALAHPENFSPLESKTEKISQMGEAVSWFMIKWALIVFIALVIIILIFDKL